MGLLYFKDTHIDNVWSTVWNHITRRLLLVETWSTLLLSRTKIAAHHARLTLLRLLCHLTHRLTGTLIVLIARTDLHTACTTTLRCRLLRWSRYIRLRCRNGTRLTIWNNNHHSNHKVILHTRIPYAHLCAHIEHRRWSTWHALPSAAKEIIRCRLAL